MKITYLVDTDWVIDHLNRKEEVKAKLKELKPEGVALSIISVAELYEGVHYSRDPVKNRRILKTLLGKFPVLGISQDICDIFGEQRGKLRKMGTLVADFDLLIAATCLCHDLTLLTNNVRHFERIERLRIISLAK